MSDSYSAGRALEAAYKEWSETRCIKSPTLQHEHDRKKEKWATNQWHCKYCKKIFYTK